MRVVFTFFHGGPFDVAIDKQVVGERLMPLDRDLALKAAVNLAPFFRIGKMEMVAARVGVGALTAKRCVSVGLGMLLALVKSGLSRTGGKRKSLIAKL